MKEVRGPILVSLFTIIFLFAGLALYTKLFGPLFAPASTNVFRVEGQGSVSAVPDTSNISFGVNKVVNAASQIEAEKQAHDIINKIVEEIKKQGVETKDIKTTNFSVYPNYAYVGSKVATGYTISENVDIKVSPIDKANKVLDVITSNGADVVSTSSFSLDATKRSELQQQARIEAIKNAKKKAEELANAAGIHLGRIVDIQENSTPEFSPQPMMLKASGIQNAVDNTNLNPGENTVSATITLSYETR